MNRKTEILARAEYQRAVLIFKDGYLALGKTLLETHPEIPHEGLAEGMIRAAFELTSSTIGPGDAARQIRTLAGELEHLATMKDFALQAGDAGNAKEGKT